MSHFTVMVIGDNIEAQLQPYHEYECTGTKDRYVVWVDETAEKTEEYENPENTIPMIFKDGAMLFNRYDKRAELFWRRDGYGISSSDKFVLPEGYELREVPKKEVYPSLESYMRGWEGYGDENFHNGQIGRFTNPSAKWDWWVIGGRWTGFLKLKSGARADGGLKKEIDFDGMREAEALKASADFDKAMQALDAAQAPTSWQPWEDVRESSETIDIARSAYKEQPSVKALRSVFDNPFFEVDQFLCSRDEYVEQARNKAISTYALVKDGKWYAKGEMGWWGMSSGDMDQSKWDAEVAKMLDSIPDDTPITIVDCHI